MAHDNLQSASVGVVRERNFIVPRRAKERGPRNLILQFYLASPPLVDKALREIVAEIRQRLARSGSFGHLA